MKILIILKKKKGGVGFSNSRLSKILMKMNHEIKIISREDDLKSYSLINSLFKIRNFLKKEEKKYDIIYTQDWSLALPLLFPYPIAKKKHFCCFCGNQLGITKPLQELVGKIMGKKLIVVSDTIKERFPHSKLIYRGVDLKIFKPLNKKRKYIGWVDKETEIIDENFIKKLGVLTGIKHIIAKNTPSHKMNDFYNKCKIFISLPPSSAGFNNVWAEAMAAKTPIVIGNENGLGKNWPYSKVFEGENKFKKISEIINKNEKKDYRKWIIENKISWEESAKKLLKYMEKIKN